MSLSGIQAILISCLLYTGMGIFAFQAHRMEAAISFLAVSSVRVLLNWSVVFFPERQQAQSRTQKDTFYLWLWGLCGAACVTSFFASVPVIGMGQASFLGGIQAVIVAAVAPLWLGQRNSALTWIAITGSLIGLYLLLDPNFGNGALFAKAAALISGITGAIAFLAIAKIPKVSAKRVMLYWCFTATSVHVVLAFIYPLTWPKEELTWLVVVLAGLCAAGGQFFSALAYQKSPASQLAVITYSIPALSALFDAWLFGIIPSPRAFIGIALIFGFGIALSLSRHPPSSRSVRPSRLGQKSAA